MNTNTSCLAALLIAGIAAVAPAAAQDAARSGHVTANGVDYYYEIQGEGDPLLLLHGGLGTSDMFDPMMDELGAERQVITVDLHGHGRTPLAGRDISLIDIGDDLATILDEIGVDQVDALGYSFGGGAAFRLAVQHPEKVRRLAMVSAGFSRDGFFPDILAQQEQVGAGMADMMKETPMYTAYESVAPDVDEFPALLDAMGSYMSKPYDWSEDAKALEMPVMLVFGDADMYRPEHMVEFYQLLGGGLRDAGWMRENISQNRLAILPNRTHYDMLFAPDLIGTVRPFLDGEAAVGTWEDFSGEAQ